MYSEVRKLFVYEISGGKHEYNQIAKNRVRVRSGNGGAPARRRNSDGTGLSTEPGKTRSKAPPADGARILWQQPRGKTPPKEGATAVEVRAEDGTAWLLRSASAVQQRLLRPI